jgi:chromatin assembly factor 1 subunit B
MKFVVKEIYWHGDRERLMSIDIFDEVMVTCGADIGEEDWVRFWSFDNATGDVNYLGSLPKHHERTVNIARFSPNGTILATGADDCAVILWQRRDPANHGEWTGLGILRGHTAEINDISWSHDGLWLATAGMDATVNIWNVTRRSLS